MDAIINKVTAYHDQKMKMDAQYFVQWKTLVMKSLDKPFVLEGLILPMDVHWAIIAHNQVLFMAQMSIAPADVSAIVTKTPVSKDAVKETTRMVAGLVITALPNVLKITRHYSFKTLSYLCYFSRLQSLLYFKFEKLFEINLVRKNKKK